MNCAVNLNFMAAFIGLSAFFISITAITLVMYCNADRLEKYFERKFLEKK